MSSCFSRWLLLLQAFILGLLLTGGAFALDASEMFDDPAKEARAREVGRSLRCMVCQNQSIFDSNASLAKDLRVVVRRRIDAGDTDDEILEFVAARYGDFVLLEPPVAARTYVLWAAPMIFLLIGIGLFFAYHRGRTSSHLPSGGKSGGDGHVLGGEGS